MLNKQRFDQIIDLIIKQIEFYGCICNGVNALGVKEIITLEEYDQIMCKLLLPKFLELANNGYTYDINGNWSKSGAYRFQNKQQRIQFLNQLKESYEENRA